MAADTQIPQSLNGLKTNVRAGDRARSRTPFAWMWEGLRSLGRTQLWRRPGRAALRADPGLVSPLWGAARDGIRPLLSYEAGAYLAHLVRLDPDSRRHRFGRPIEDRDLARFVAAIDWSRALVLAHVEEGRVRGAAHLAWPDVEWLGGDGELAVAVEGGWRRRGIGRVLLERATGEARARGLAGIMFFTRADNEAMLALAQHFDAPLDYFGSEVEGRVPLAPPPALRSRYFAGMAV